MMLQRTPPFGKVPTLDRRDSELFRCGALYQFLRAALGGEDGEE